MEMTESEARGFVQGKLNCMKKCDIFDCKNTNECDNCDYCYSQGTFGEQKEAFEMAIKALEKQIPKEAIITGHNNSVNTDAGECPICNDAILRACDCTYCPNCGQRLEWNRMSDLISRSGLYMNDLIRRKDVLALFPTNDCSDKMVGLYERVLDIPTAYDVEKVVAELEKLPNREADYYYANSNDVIDREDAIEIVKQGGVSDDVCEWRLCDEEANVYDTSCRNPHILIEGTPKENNYEYCPYCGKKIKVVE